MLISSIIRIQYQKLLPGSHFKISVLIYGDVAFLNRFKEEDPEKIYPRSSFCINCKGEISLVAQDFSCLHR